MILTCKRREARPRRGAAAGEIGFALEASAQEKAPIFPLPGFHSAGTAEGLAIGTVEGLIDGAITGLVLSLLYDAFARVRSEAQTNS